jgi:hypothetical protein
MLRTQILKSVAWWFCVFAIVSCGAPMEGDPFAEPGANGPLAGGKYDQAGEVEPPTLASTYVFEADSRVILRDEEGEQSIYLSRIAALVDVVQDGDVLNLELYPCSIDLPELDGKKPSIDLEVFRAMPAVKISGGLAYADEVWTFWTEEVAIVLGAELADPLTEALPTDKDDERVVDVDGDGKPGVSIKISLFKVYASVRMKLELSGDIRADETISGSANAQIEQQIYGDNIPFVDAAKMAAEAAEQSDLVEESHTFTLRPLDPATANCDDHALTPVEGEPR